jgi:hypothetical protein
LPFWAVGAILSPDESSPFAGARVRIAGVSQLLITDENLPYVQFVDGSCVLSAGWLLAVQRFLEERKEVAAAFGP